MIRVTGLLLSLPFISRRVSVNKPRLPVVYSTNKLRIKSLTLCGDCGCVPGKETNLPYAGFASSNVGTNNSIASKQESIL